MSSQMGTIDYDIVEDLFCRCLELEPEEQISWLKTHCNHNLELFDEVKSLLVAHNESNTFLEKPVQFETLSPTERKRFKQQSEAKYIGKTIGAYQLDSLLGRGGMGCVYLAHRTDGEYEQEVAIKIVESSTLEGLLFKRERQILAQLNHPNIVTLHDGGTLSNGGSYFVMEKVDGLSIDQHIEKKKLNTRQIIHLMISLGLVVQDAHQHGIIHCDLKPANILVTDDGVLKLLDFGISQLLSHSTTENDELPTPKRFALTPEYSSPRRHQQHTPVISDDVFSLGILLSHTLSGKIPAVLIPDLTLFPEPDIPKTAQHIDDYELRQIFLKATHPSEKQRYASAKSLVNDLQNWLENRAVKAVGNDSLYVLKKHIIRNWQYWGVASVLILTLITTGSIWLHKMRLEKESQQAQQTTEDMLADLDHALEALPHTTLIRKKLIETAYKRISQHSKNAPNNAAIKKIEADTLSRLAEVTGHPYALNQGNIKEALAQYQKSLKIYQSLRDKYISPIELEVDIANTQRRIAEIKAYQGDMKAGLDMMASIRSHMESVFADVPLGERLPLIIHYTVEAHGYFHTQDLKKAKILIEKAWKIALANQEPEKYYLILAFLHEETGHLALLMHHYKNAKQEYLTVIEKYRDSDLWQHRRRLARSYNGLACIALKNGNTDLALQDFQKIKQAFENLNIKYPNVKSIQDKLDTLKRTSKKLAAEQQPTEKTLSKVLNCDNPLQFMIPPKKTPQKL